jgi:hypothetical protein
MRLGLTKIAHGLIVALVVLSILELGLIYALRRVSGLYSAGEKFPALSGYLLNQRFWVAPSVPCQLLRVTSDGCPYSVLDQRQYWALLQRAREAGCLTVVVAPRNGDVELNEDSNVVQLQFVDMNLGRVIYPFLTPQTILLDRNGRVKWQRQGSLDERSLEQGLQAIGGLRQKES